jgi:hypothetical protein
MTASMGEEAGATHCQKGKLPFSISMHSAAHTHKRSEKLIETSGHCGIAVLNHISPNRLDLSGHRKSLQ